MKAIGIDLGTTNSAAAVGGRDAKVLPTRMGEPLTPSVVSLVKKRNAAEGEIVVGRAAVNNATRDPINTVFSIKRLMGLVYGDQRLGKGYGARGLEDIRAKTSFQIAPQPSADSEDQGIRVLIDGKPYTPVEVSAIILRQIREDAEQALGEPVTHAVITVPAYFEERQRNATREAGLAAGLNVLQIIDEPTAAAIAYGVGKEAERHRVLVYDLGGGTFDISIIQMVGGQYQVLEIQGDNWLGGDDFDQTIVKRMIDWVKQTYDTDPSEDRLFLAKAKEEAQRTKIALSTQQSVEIFAPLLKLEGQGIVDVDMVITREEFEADIAPMVERTLELVQAALKNQSFEPDSITEVLLVGGSTAVPLVQQRVGEFFGQGKVKRQINPMECVALGAGVLAGQFELTDEGVANAAEVESRHVQVTAMHLGIAAVKGDNPDSFVPIIPKGTPFPLSEPRKQIFYPSAESQRVLRVPVFEGMNDLASLNEQQGILELPLEDAISIDTPIEVAFNYDRNRTLTILVRVMKGGHKPFEEVLKRDRGRLRPDGAAKKLADDWREELQPSIRAARHFLDNYGEFMDATDRLELEAAANEADTVLASNDEANGERLKLLLQNKMWSSGTASQLFIAERVIENASASDAADLARATQALREAHRRGDNGVAAKLSDVLRLRVAQVIHERRVEHVADRQSFNDMLRVRS